MIGLLATDRAEIISPAVLRPVRHKLHLKKNQGYKIRANQPGGTFLLNIVCRSQSPRQSARIANAVAAEFINHEYHTRSAALLNLSGYMRQQIEQLRARMERSQLALHRYARSNGIANVRNTLKLITQKLVFLQADMETEQARQRKLQANLELARQGNLDALLVSSRGQSLAPLVQAVQSAQIKFAQLASRFGPGNYLYVQASRNLRLLRANLARAEGHVALQIRAEAKANALQLALTRRQLASASAQLAVFNNKTVQYGILKHEADSNQTLYDNLLQRLNSADISAGYRSTALRIVDSARPNPVPVFPRIGLSLLLAFLLSSIAGVAAAIAMTGLDRTLRDPETASRSVGVATLASLPFATDNRDLESLLMSGGQLALRHRSQFAEAVLGLRSTLLLSYPGLSSLAITSAQPREGKSTVSVNLACAFALMGKRTVLIDADIRRPEIHRLLHLSNHAGLSSVLLGEAMLDRASQAGPVPGLTVLTAGPSVMNPGELLGNGMARLVEGLKSKFEIVLIDTPPMLGFADSLGISAIVDCMLLVARAGETPRDLVRAALQQLQQVRARVAGLVLNGVSHDMSYHYYYHRHYYSRYYGEDRADREALRQSAGESQ